MFVTEIPIEVNFTEQFVELAVQPLVCRTPLDCYYEYWFSFSHSQYCGQSKKYNLDATKLWSPEGGRKLSPDTGVSLLFQ